MCTKPICDSGTKPYYPAMEICDFQPLCSDNRQPGKDMKKPRTATIKCPHCHNEAKLLSFGEGWVGVCCNQLVYNQRYQPGEQAE